MGVLLRLVTRTSWRGWVVVVVVALCAAYLTGTMVLLEGLRQGVDTAASRLPGSPALAYRGMSLTDSSVDPRDLEGLGGAVASFRIFPVSVTFGDTMQWPAYALAVEDGSDLAGLRPWTPTQEDQAFLGGDLRDEVQSAGLDPSHMEIGGLPLNASTYPDQTLIPNDWVLISEGLLARLSGAPVDPSFVLLDRPGDAQHLADRGYTVVATANAVTFLQNGVEGAVSALAALVIVSVAVTLLLVSTLLGLEIRYRGRDLALVRALGGSDRFTFSLALTQALYLTLLGACLGTALGIMAAHGLVSAAPLLGLTNVLAPRLTPEAVALGLGAVPACGLLGALASLIGFRPSLRRGWV